LNNFIKIEHLLKCRTVFALIYEKKSESVWLYCFFEILILVYVFSSGMAGAIYIKGVAVTKYKR